MAFFWQRHKKAAIADVPPATPIYSNLYFPTRSAATGPVEIAKRPAQAATVSTASSDISDAPPDSLDGADIFPVAFDQTTEPPEIVLADLRVAVAQSLGSGLAATMEQKAALAPPQGSMWANGWAAFTPLEKTTWLVTAATDSLLAAALGHNNSVTRLDGITPAQTHTLATEISNIQLDAGGWPQDWTDDDRARFECIAYATQVRAGFWPAGHARFRPAAYGNFWLTYDGGLAWYEWMHASRKVAHQNCLDAIAAASAKAGAPVNVMDIGCGMGVGYGDALKGHRFTGVDLEPRGIAWCQENRAHPGHAYLCRDVLVPEHRKELVTLGSDFVFSSGTIDNTWNIDAYLEAMAAMTTRWLYIAAYRGWYGDLPVHRYNWQPATAAYYNDISPRQIERQLRALGFKTIDVSPMETGNPPPQSPLETRILAER